MSFQKILPENPARRTILNLMRVHQGTIARIESGEKFYKNLKDVTDEAWAAALGEIEQCRKVLVALDSMDEGNLKRAQKLLGQIQEFIPDVH